MFSKRNFMFSIIKFRYLQFLRYILRKKYTFILDGELKGFEWSLHTNYDYILGTYEPPIILEFIKVKSLEKDFVCYDCGANAGHFSILSSILSKSNGIVYAFEPIREHVSVMNNHITKNIKNYPSLSKIQLFPWGITNEVKNLSFSNNEGSEGNTYVKKSPNQLGKSVEVKCVSIDNLVFKQGYLPPSLIKIDVEGAEYDVLIGSENTIIKYRPSIILATHDFHLLGVKDKCLKFLLAKGYIITPTLESKIYSSLEDFIAIYKPD